jgi:prevent-host-death family protein
MQVPIHELKAGLSHYLAQAQAGEVVEVTSHRKPVARIVGVPATDNAGLAALTMQGAVSWNGAKPTFEEPLTLTPQGKAVSQLILEDRG